MKTPLQIIAIIICLIPFRPSLLQADDIEVSTDRHIQLGDRYFLNNQYFSAVNEYEQAVKNRTDNPELFRRLSFLYFHLGFLDKAVDAGERAVTLSPDSELFRMELGVAYFAKNLSAHRARLRRRATRCGRRRSRCRVGRPAPSCPTG